MILEHRMYTFKPGTVDKWMKKYEAEGLPVLWDLEVPLGHTSMSFRSWPHNRSFLSQWLSERKQPVHIWRSHTTMGLNPLFLRMVGLHFDPLDYPAVSLHLDLYATGDGLPDDQMARVLTNLMRNAIQALTQAGAEAGSQPLLTVTGAPTNGSVTLRVIDNGPGVPQRARANLFQAFRGSVTPGGTGLGLAVAAELVRLHGGTIELEPSPVGAVFRVSLPLRRGNGH